MDYQKSQYSHTSQTGIYFDKYELLMQKAIESPQG